MNLALLDLNSANLKKAGEALKPKNNEKTETYTMDVSSVSDWSKVKADVESKFGSVDLLMLNAGASFRLEGGK
jgi:short-subunit dehydrogenase